MRHEREQKLTITNWFDGDKSHGTIIGYCSSSLLFFIAPNIWSIVTFFICGHPQKWNYIIIIVQDISYPIEQYLWLVTYFHAPKVFVISDKNYVYSQVQVTRQFRTARISSYLTWQSMALLFNLDSVRLKVHFILLKSDHVTYNYHHTSKIFCHYILNGNESYDEDNTMLCLINYNISLLKWSQ